ncbi:MAG: 1,4-alpha-glucan branching protein GlgB [Candidatus Dormibacteraceae bacterium]
MITTSRLSSEDIYLFHEGRQFRLYRHLGAHLEADGAWFGVWAPNAERVEVVGDFNWWQPEEGRLERLDASGIWQGWVSGARAGQYYKYRITTADGQLLEKADPMALASEILPGTASVLTDLNYQWGDEQWMANRASHNALNAPWSIYELHLGSWQGPNLGYSELAERISRHVEELGFTHVELMPIMEHPFYGSWGYQVSGYFAPTSRYGTPQQLMELIDHLHQRGIGVILDWVPAHFPADQHSLAGFDGTAIYEHPDPQRGFHPDWKSCIFDYGRPEVRSFLTSSALFWLDHYHVDALRVDGVASMLYRDYSRNAGEWEPNHCGGRENLEAVDFLRQLNTAIYQEYPDVQSIAEESTAWPMVSRPVESGGLGFGLKWDMGWMHDTLAYFEQDPVHRRYHHDQLTFRSVYAHTENFVLPLSHDEVVHGKGSLLSKMPGDRWQQLANLRLLFAYMYAMPGKKLLFMGAEVGQENEWDHHGSVEWWLNESIGHAGMGGWLADLNRLYRAEPALYRQDFEPDGFRWVVSDDADQSVLSFLRLGEGRQLLAVFNFTPVPRSNYRLGVPEGGEWGELLNSDAEIYGGSGMGNLGAVWAGDEPCHGFSHSLELTLPPLGALFFRTAM